MKKKFQENPGYEYCKMLNLKPNDIDPKTNEVDLTKLVPDCYKRCNNNNLYLEIDTIKNKNEVTTNHYYLIEALKNDNMRIIEKYYENSRNNVNDVLLYGYPGNTEAFYTRIIYIIMLINMLLSYCIVLRQPIITSIFVNQR